MSKARYDVVSLGETMLRLSPGGFERLEQSRVFETHVGGSESNTLVGLSRLGMSTCWISRLTDNALGRVIAGTIASQGTDTAWVKWTEQDRVGLYFYEQGIDGRPSEVIYDRGQSAFSKLQVHDVPLEPLQQTALLHLTGISLALSECVRKSLDHARSIAVQHGARLSFDFNYRAKLWSMAEARSICMPWLQQADVVFIAKRDALALLGVSDNASDDSIMERLVGLRNGGATVMTLGPHGAIGSDGKQMVHVPTTGINSVGRLGAGDAFSAGFLFGWLQGWELMRSLRWGNAAAQLKLTIPGDLPWFRRSEVERVAEGKGSESLLR